MMKKEINLGGEGALLVEQGVNLGDEGAHLGEEVAHLGGEGTHLGGKEPSLTLFLSVWQAGIASSAIPQGADPLPPSSTSNECR
jgi:hypothetical protein